MGTARPQQAGPERGRRRHDRQLSRQRAAQEALGRKERSNRYRSTRRARAKACADQRNARKDFAHKATIREARRTRLGVVETLGVKNLMAKGGRRKRGLNRGLGEAGLRMILSFLSYKLVWNGGALLVAPRFYPSTKRCSRCGQVKDEMALSERIYRCARCHAVMDRDRNAGKNLEQLAPILALLTMLVGLGVVDQKAYDKMIGSWSWDRKASGSVGPTTETAWLAERSQPRATGVVLRDEPRSSPARSDTGQHNEHRFQRTGNPLEAVV
ncbi:MAG: RNA-guided endonuclease InsQ/TnpB family protein [Acidimicrobiales bacterium]